MYTTLESFYFPSEDMISPDIVYNSVFILPSLSDAAGVRLAVKKLMKRKNLLSILLPKMTTLFEIAKEAAGAGEGSIIMNTDFGYIMDGILDIPEKFKRNNSGYKNSIFALMNEMGFSQKKIAEYDFYTDLAAAGLTKEIFDLIYKTVKEKGYSFRAEIYKAAEKALTENKDPKHYYLFPGEYYTIPEQRLLEILKADTMTAPFCLLSGIHCAMFSSDPDKNYGICDAEKKVGFIKASSPFEQSMEIKNHISALMKEDGSLSLNDFAVIFNDPVSMKNSTAYFDSLDIPTVSGAYVPVSSELQDILALIVYALNGDVKKIVDHYNRKRRDDEKINCEEGYEFPPLYEFKKIVSDIAASADKKNEKRIGNFVKVIELLSDVKNISGSVDEILNKMNKIAAVLGGGGEKSVYEYKGSLLQVFGGRVSLKDAADYLIKILRPRNRCRISESNDGVVISLAGGYIPECRYLYLADMEESLFLKDMFRNALLPEEERDSFNREIYGCTKEEHLKKIFEFYTKQVSEKIIFMIPDYTEGTVPSVSIDNVMRIFPKKKCTVKINGSCIPPFEAEFFPSREEAVIENKIRASGYGFSDRNGRFSLKYRGGITPDFFKNNLSSVTKIENFFRCPAKFVYELDQPEIDIFDRKKFDRGNALHDFIEGFFEREKKSPETASLLRLDFLGKKIETIRKDVKDYILGKEAYESFDKIEVKNIFTGIKEKYPRLDLKNEDFFSFLFFTVRLIKDKLSSADPEFFKSEVFFSDFALPGVPRIKVKEGYADFIFRDKVSEGIAVLDFKSGDIDSYKEEVPGYHMIQLLLYSMIIREAASKKKYDIFAEKSLRQKKKCSFLGASYFEGLKENFTIRSFYLSPKDQSGFKNIPGWDEEKGLEDSYKEFAEKLNEKLDKAEKNIFEPEKNKNCIYCPLYDFCPVSEETGSLEIPPDKLALKEPLFKDYPSCAGSEKKEDLTSGNIKNIIQFSGKDKLEAVSDLDSDIIISAGAGAGKTEVLASRYLNILLNSSSYPENILCITFTDKAAGEMKKRIFSKINDTAALNAFYSLPSSDYGLNEAQRKKLAGIKADFYKRNRISTFHSFCINMLSRFGKNDAGSGRDIKSAIADSYIIRKKKIELIKNKIKKISDPALKKWIQYRKVYYSYDSSKGGIVYDILDFIDDYKLSGLEFDGKNYKVLFDDFPERKRKIIDRLKEEYEEIKSDILSDLLSLAKEEGCGSKAVNAEIDKLRNDRISKNAKLCKFYKERPELLKKIDDLLKTRYWRSLFGSDPEIADDTETENSIRKALFVFAGEIDREISEFKTENNYAELSDYHLDFIKLLQDDDILREIKKEIKFIMVDEFQDTNWLQKIIIEKLHDSSNRLFIVGDLKQSIYRFLQCDNQIFKYFRDKEGMKYLTFQENFRSESEIVKFGNFYFSSNKEENFNIIKNTSRKSSDIEFALPVRRAAVEGSLRVNIVRIFYDMNSYPDLTAGELETFAMIKEASFIANTIKKSGVRRYGSWGILIPAYANIEYILKSLKQAGIPYSFIMKKDFFRLPEISEFIILLKVIYGFMPGSVLAPNSYFFKLISSFDRTLLSKGFVSVINRIISSEEYSGYLSEKGRETEALLDEFISKCGLAASRFNESKEDIFYHLDMLTEDNSEEYEISRPDSVKIMTVHSAKGLEFDNLFVSKMARRERNDGSVIRFLNLLDDETKRHIIDFDVSGIKEMDGSERRFIYSDWIKDKNSEFEREEKGNLLYVAFTRAKDNLIITTTGGMNAKGVFRKGALWHENISSNIFGSDACGRSKDMIADLHGCKCRIIETEIDKIAPPSDDRGRMETAAAETGYLPRKGDLDSVSVSDFIDIEFPFEKESERGVLGTAGVPGSETETGTAVHKFFEENISKLKEDKFDMSSLDLKVSESIKKKSENFIRTGCSNADFRDLIYSADLLAGEKALFFRTEKNILLNGVIDLILENRDGIALLDYKTHAGELLDPETMKRYKRQLELYEEGISGLYPGKKITKYLLLMSGTGRSELMRI